MGEDTDEKDSTQKTVFVRNLPFTTSNTKLEEAFQEFGPIKQAFVVKDPDNHSQCRGFGYVQFALQDAATSAVAASIELEGRKLALALARKKPKHEKRKQEKADKEKVIETPLEAGDISETSQNKKRKSKVEPEQEKPAKKLKVEIAEEEEQLVTKKKMKKPKEVVPNATKKASETNEITEEKSAPSATHTDLQRTIVVTGLTEKVRRKELRVGCERFGTIENIVYPVIGREAVTAFIRYKDYKSTIRAVQKVTGMKVKKSNTLSAVLLSKEDKHPPKKILQACRLIVRNLNFNCSEVELKNQFQKFGRVFEIKIPTKVVNNRDVKLGYAFVQFVQPADARKALEAVNMTEIMNRVVIVDWAVPKDQYTQAKKEVDVPKNEENNKEKKTKEKKKKKEEVKEEEEDDEDEDDEDEGDDVDDESDVEIENEEEIDDTDDVDVENDDDEGDEEDFEDDGDEDDEDDQFTDEEEEEDEEEKALRLARKKVLQRDTKEGRTVFLRNLSYETDEDTITEQLEKYGDIDSCRLVCDPETGHSKGTAFVKFTLTTSAEACVEEMAGLASEDKHLRIDNRSIIVAMAVTRGKVASLKLEEAKRTKETDKRNLHLAYEGVVARNSPAADGVSEADLARREKMVQEKKNKLKNPNFFVSPTRLSFRNLPLAVDNAKLRSVIEQHCEKGVEITWMKVLRNKERKDTTGVPRSLGFSFVEFASHAQALRALRALNNNPSVFDGGRRAVVEFAVENSRAVKIIEQRKQKAALRQRTNASSNDTQVGTNQDGAADSGYSEQERARYRKLAQKKQNRKEKFQKRREERRKAREDGAKDEPSDVMAKVDSTESGDPSSARLKSTTPTSQTAPAKKKKPKQATSESATDIPTTTAIKSNKKLVKQKPTDADSDNKNDNNKHSVAAMPVSKTEKFVKRKAKNVSLDKDERRFNSLVSKYKRKLTGPGNSVTKKKTIEARWFE